MGTKDGFKNLLEASWAPKPPKAHINAKIHPDISHALSILAERGGQTMSQTSTRTAKERGVPRG